MPGNFSQVIKDYLASPQLEAKAESTRYRRRHELLLAEVSLGHFEVEQIRPALIQAHLDGLADFPGKQATAREALKALEKWAIVRDKLPYPITTGTEVIGSDGGHEPWPEAEINIAVANARPDLARVIWLAYQTGQRGSDIVKMRWSDIETDDGRTGINVTQKKTDIRLWIPFTQDFAAELSAWTKTPPFFLVLAPDGRQFTRNRLSHDWTMERDTNPALSRHKEMGLVLHGLRASAVIRLHKLGFTTLEISNLVGMSIPMVARYTRLAEKKKMNIASVERIEKLTGSNVKTLQPKSLKSKDPTL